LLVDYSFTLEWRGSSSKLMRLKKIKILNWIKDYWPMLQDSTRLLWHRTLEKKLDALKENTLCHWLIPVLMDSSGIVIFANILIMPSQVGYSTLAPFVIRTFVLTASLELKKPSACREWIH
jgi:hypothetical protein